MPSDSPDKLRMAQEFEEGAAALEEPQAPPKTFVREIDLGDGSGKQRFEAPTQEGLIDKLAEAQANATRKIRELAQQTKPRVREPEKESSDWQALKPGVLKAEDILQLEKNPRELFRRMCQTELGLNPEEWIQRENDRRKQQAEFNAQNEFVRTHQDYNPSPENAQKIVRFLERENLPISKVNLDYAYSQLRDELAAKTVTSPPATTESQAQQPTRTQPISSPPSFVRSSLGGRPPEEAGGGNDAAEIARIAQLPPSEMRARIEQLYRQQRSSR